MYIYILTKININHEKLETKKNLAFTSNCLRFLTFCDVPPPSECEETVSALPCKRFLSF